MTGSDASTTPTQSSVFRQVGLFLAVAYALALAIALALPHAGIAPLISIPVPAVAVAVTVLATVRPGRRRTVWAEVGFGRPSWQALLAALAGPAVIVGASFAVAAAVGVVRFAAPADGTQLATQAVSLLAFAVVFLGEEVGWRGFLLARLCALMPARRAVLVAGACQAAFHLPLLTLTTTYQSAGSRWIVVPMVLVTLTLAGAWYGWLRLWSGSIWPVTLAHSAFNHFMDVAAGAVVAASPAAMAYTTTETGVVTMLVVAAVAAYLLTRRAADFRRPALASS